MLRIKLYQSSKSMENYLNKKSNKGHNLDKIITFGLFEPLRLDAYYFKRDSIKNRVYRVDSRKLSKEDFSEYKQIFLDDGWNYFSENYANDNFNVDHIFFSDDPSKQAIFSDVESERKRDHDNAASSLYKGTILLVILMVFSLLFPSINSGSSNTLLGFLLHNLYSIVAVLIVIVSSVKFFKSR